VESPAELLPAAIELASLIGSYPQECLRADRQSVYLRTHATDPTPEWRRALQGEFSRGSRVVTKESIAGAQRFAVGEGRGGQIPGPKASQSLPHAKL